MGRGHSITHMMLKQNMKAIVTPYPILLVEFAYAAVKPIINVMQHAIAIPVIHIVGLRPHLSTKGRQIMFAAGPTIPRTC